MEQDRVRRAGRVYWRSAGVQAMARDSSGMGRPAWAVRIRSERKARGWPTEEMARRLRDAADGRARAQLPSLGVLVSYVRRWESGAVGVTERYRLLYTHAFDIDEATLFEGAADPVPTDRAVAFGPMDLAALSDEVTDLAAWIEQTNVGDSTIDLLAEAVSHLAEQHTRVPPRRLLVDVVRLHRRTQSLLRAGKQRLRHTRELFRIEADLLAHSCILLGDLHNDGMAIGHGAAGALCAEEAGGSRAAALSAQAKTQRWRRRYALSADLARQGFECSPPTPVRVLLASQEANAAALLGDSGRAREALTRAEEAASSPLSVDSGVSPWSCPRPRQALYALSVAIHTGDPRTALQAAAMADAGWASGDPWVYGTWAQVRFGAAIAHVMAGDLDAAAGEVTPVLTLPPEFRLATITNYLVELDERLKQKPFQRSDAAAAMREQIREFNAAAPSIRSGEGAT